MWWTIDRTRATLQCATWVEIDGGAAIDYHLLGDGFRGPHRTEAANRFSSSHITAVASRRIHVS